MMTLNSLPKFIVTSFRSECFQYVHKSMKSNKDKWSIFFHGKTTILLLLMLLNVGKALCVNLAPGDRWPVNAVDIFSLHKTCLG